MIFGIMSLPEWQEIARRDDCLDQMVPSDLRTILGDYERAVIANKIATTRVAALEAAVREILQHDDVAFGPLAGELETQVRELVTR